MVVVVDYGMGNVGSILNMLKKVGTDAVLSSRTDDIASADKIILPGVGAFDHGMKNLRDAGLIPVLESKVLVEKKPVFGICLGAQLFMERSEEGILSGLGWIKGETVRFRFDAQSALRVPHMGWNTVLPAKENALFHGYDESPRFYFAHSYHLKCEERNDVLAESMYGYPFAAAIQHENIYGVQFHPEKSHKFGLKLMQNFVEHV